MNWSEKNGGRWRWTDRQTRWLGAALALSAGLAYLQWGDGSQSAILFEMESTVLSKLWKAPSSVLHPFVLLPLSGQLMLIGNTFLSRPRPGILLVGLALLGSLVAFVFLIGIMGKNLVVAGSCLPFLVLAGATLRLGRRQCRALENS